MAIEKFSTLKPAPGQGKRIMKSKLLTALGATGVLAPYPQNPEHILERKILLQAPFNTAGGGSSNPCAAGLPQTAIWVANVQANGGAAPSASTQAAAACFWSSMIAAGLDVKTIAVNLFAPDNLTAAITPFYFTKGSNPWTNHSFVAGDLSTAGLKGNKVANPYLDTGVKVSDFAGDNNIGLCLVSLKDNGIGLDGTFQSGQSNGALSTGIFLGRNSIDSNEAFHTGGAFPTNAAETTKADGFWAGSRVASNDIRIFFGNNATTVAQSGATGTNAGATIVGNNNNLNVFSINLTGVSVNFDNTADTISFFWMGQGLLLADWVNVYSAVKTMRNSFGGGFP